VQPMKLIPVHLASAISSAQPTKPVSPFKLSICLDEVSYFVSQDIFNPGSIFTWYNKFVEVWTGLNNVCRFSLFQQNWLLAS
jgi:hypothetical protein